MKKTPLKRHKRLNPRSDKQREKNNIWAEVTEQKAYDLGYMCQWCGKSMKDMAIAGHHIIPRRFNIHTYENCFVCHWFTCHDEADKADLPYPDRNLIGVKVFFESKSEWGQT